MIWFIVILLWIMFSSANLSGRNEFQKDYLSKDSANAIKGIFVFLIMDVIIGRSYS